MISKAYAAAAGVVVVVLVGVILFAGFLPAGQAAIALTIRDPPPQMYSADVQSINITFTEIQVHMVNSTGDSWITLTSNQSTTIDLLHIVNSTESLGSFNIPAGNYTEIRFMVSSATATINGTVVQLTIPSGAQTGLKAHFPNSLTLKAGSSVDIMLDISADDSGIHHGMMVPSLTAMVSG